MHTNIVYNNTFPVKNQPCSANHYLIFGREIDIIIKYPYISGENVSVEQPDRAHTF